MPGVHADGYLGFGDSITLKVRTRIDNLDSSNVLEGNLFDGAGDLVSYKDQMNTINTWTSGSTNVYLTAHDSDLGFMPNGSNWTHVFDADVASYTGDDGQPKYSVADQGKNYISADVAKSTHNNDRPGAIPSDLYLKRGDVAFKAKSRVAEGANVSSFAPQDVDRFFKNSASAKESDSDGGGDEEGIVDHDKDGDYTDPYVTDEGGYLRIRKPSSSVRADTSALRNNVGNKDLGSTRGDDATLKNVNDFFITQAINTRAAR